MLDFARAQPFDYPDSGFCAIFTAIIWGVAVGAKKFASKQVSIYLLAQATLYLLVSLHQNSVGSIPLLFTDDCWNSSGRFCGRKIIFVWMMDAEKRFGIWHANPFGAPLVFGIGHDVREGNVGNFVVFAVTVTTVIKLVCHLTDTICARLVH